MEQYERTRLLIGEKGLAILKDARVIVFGLGGVGGAACEALARAGIGSLDLVDGDVVAPSNLNRQVIALRSTIGMDKTEVMAKRIHEIDPGIGVTCHRIFYLPENADALNLGQYDYILDAIDNVTAKVELITRAKSQGIPVISSMGTGNRMDAASFRIGDLAETTGCPLAKVMRRELRIRGILHLQVLYSPEVPMKQRPPGSISFVPPVAGLLMAGEVVRNLLKQGEGNDEK